MNGKSLNITEEKLVRLRELFPEVFSEEKVDWEKLRVVLSGAGEFKDERYHLNWAGKTDSFRVLQSPTTATLRPCREESIDFDGSGNLFIEGENLEVLKTLQKSYFGKVRMIYIDPPYNTGNDHFIYPDRFAESKDAYLKRIGDKDEQGRMTREGMFRKNSRENGHFHSNWLSMIYPRLFLARNLLRADGVIFMSIDDNEVHNLRMVMNEIFGEENFVGCIAWKKTSGDNKPSFAFTHDNILIYGKTTDQLPRHELSDAQKKQYKNPDNDHRGLWAESDYRSKWTKTQRKNLYYAITNPNTGEEIYPDTYSTSPRVWGCSWETHCKNEKQGLVWWGKDGKSKEPKRKRFLAVHRGTNTRSVWLDAGTNDEASDELNRIFPDIKNIFDNPKPVKLLKKIISICQSNNGIYLDFFAGSCTTAHAVMQLNAEDGGKREFICIQIPEPCDEKSEACKVGYKTIADIGKERIRRIIKQDNTDDGYKIFKLQKSNFKTWHGDQIRDKQELEKQMKLHITPLVEDAQIEDVLYELLLKSGLSLTAEIENKGDWFLVRDLDITIALALESIDEATIKTILAANPQKFITLDHLFQNNDQLKTNTALLMEDAGIEFQTV